MANVLSGERAKMSPFARWWKNWVATRSAQTELGRLDTFQVSGIARDLGASPSELRSMAGKWPDSADHLLQRMRMLNLEPAKVDREQPAVSRDLTKHCSLCLAKTRCGRDLASRAVGPAWREYCPNSATLQALVSGRDANSNSDGA
jgi:hypothetical protein